MYCKYCGKKVSEKANFCSFCGHSLQNAEETTVEINNKYMKGSKKKFAGISSIWR